MEVPPPKRQKDEEPGAVAFQVKKAVSGAAALCFELRLPGSGTLQDLVESLAVKEGCGPELITVVSRGKPLKDATAALSSLAEGGSPVPVVYIVRKPAAAAGAPEAVAKAAQPGRRVILLLRHGQCCHEGESDELKELTPHGHKQAEDTARFISKLLAAGKLPSKRCLLHSTSRRARETAAKLPLHVQGLETWNADLLRETDPTEKPFRAEEVYQRLFAPCEAGESETLIVVAHNNIILYMLMRAAGVPIERAAQAWALFHLRHASITRVEVSSAGEKKVISIGSCAQIDGAAVTWKNVTGADMSAWKGGGPERHKFGGRMLVLVRQARGESSVRSVAEYVKSLSGYMMSGKALVACTGEAQATANAIASKFKTVPQLLPDSITGEPEAAFLQFFSPGSSRDTVILVAEDAPLLYMLLRSLGMSNEDSKAARALYSIGPGSATLINIRSDGSTKVIGVGDTYHLPVEDT